MLIRMAQLFVDDQDKALAFYTEKLGFQVDTDASYGEYRWLSVVSSEDPDGPRLLLGKPDTPGGGLQKARYESGTPAIVFNARDIDAEYEALVAKGVQFKAPPARQPYGGTDAVFDDTCGNLICLHQDWVRQSDGAGER